jgi:hypothetical protein
MEESPRFLEEALARGVFRAVAEPGVFFQFGLLHRGKPGGYFHCKGHMDVARTVTLDVFHAFAFEPKESAGLGADGILMVAWQVSVGNCISAPSAACVKLMGTSQSKSSPSRWKISWARNG